ncbi:hypothetical protein JCM8547_008219 [Rhodosporidiobolus lusitaniae]
MLEKQQLPAPAVPSRLSTTRVKLAWVGFCTLFLIFQLDFGAILPLPTPFWRAQTVRSGSVYWTTCPDSPSTYCSFLNVPLDYTNPQADDYVSLALRMIPATAPPKEQLGYLLLNPGGPGGSGTGAVVDLAPFLSPIYQGRYNLVSWDPRGVNMTSPTLNCFERGGDANRFVHELEHIGLSFEARGSPSLGFSPQASNASELNWVTKLDGFARALNSACEQANSRILRASSTAFTARDMKSIMEALGMEKLNYWGFSYGTILGATFSAMFPDLVGRFILDGVSDAEKYHENLWEWGLGGMNTTRKVIEGFFNGCVASGPAGCAFAREGSTAEDLEERYWALLEKLRAEPLAVGSSEVGPGTIGPSEVQYTIFHALYQPRTWPHMAELLNSTEAGDGSALYSVANAGSGHLGRGKHHLKNPFNRPLSNFIESGSAIMCTDTNRSVVEKTSVRDYYEFVYGMRESTRSPNSDMWATWISPCLHWSAKAIERYTGPWSRAAGLKKTANPILFFSQTADPVTPLPAARKMSAAFGEDSGTLLVQEGFGHCSFAHPSLCTAKHMRNYLLKGVLPEPGTECKGDPDFLFPRPGKALAAFEALTPEDRALRNALDGLAQRAPRYAMGRL